MVEYQSSMLAQINFKSTLLYRGGGHLYYFFMKYERVFQGSTAKCVRVSYKISYVLKYPVNFDGPCKAFALSPYPDLKP